MNTLSPRLLLAIRRGAQLAALPLAASTLLTGCFLNSESEEEEPALRCGATLGELPSAQYPAGSFGNNQYPANVPQEGRYLVCATLPSGQTCSPGAALDRDARQAHLNLAMDQSGSGCGTKLYTRDESSACGPVSRPDGKCCYLMEVYVAQCVEGRPFVIDGCARLAQTNRAAGWCDAPYQGLADELTDAQREIAANAWAIGGLHEHASVASFGKFMMELLSYGAPSELVQAAAQAIQDEIAHARLCFAVASSYAGVALAPDALDITHSVMARPEPADLLRAVIEEGCIGETLSAHVARSQAAWVKDARVKQALITLADEETRHAELAWSFVAWLLAQYPELAPIAQQTFSRGFVHHCSPRPHGLDESQQLLMEHGVLPDFLQDELRRDALRSLVTPTAQALLTQTAALHAPPSQAQAPAPAS